MLWVLGGVLVFAVLTAGTLLTLVRNPPPIGSTRAGTAVQAAAITPTPPTGTATPVEELASSILSRVHLADATCPMVQRRPDTVGGPQLERYLDSLVDCLMQVHQKPFEDAGVRLSRPRLLPESQLAGSGCVTSHDKPAGWAGLYCGANATIYYRSDWSPGRPQHYVEVISHEFAHHLQQEADILARVSAEQRTARGEPNGAARAQELTRRLELQAECLTGIAVGPRGPLAVRPAEFDALVEARSSVPPEWAATHGTGRAQSRWFKAGAEATGPDRLAVCNTFSAPAGLVE